jgi:ankyrin repeat protein
MKETNMSVVQNLFLAAQTNDIEMMKEALKTTPVDTPAESESYTALMIAANYGFLDMVNLLIEAGANVNAKSDGGVTALQLCISPKHDESARIAVRLLAAGADAHVKTGGGNTPLMEAVYMANMDVIKVLLSANVDVNAKNQYGETALMTVFVGGDEPEIVSLLLDAGADKELVNVDGESAADIAHRLSRAQAFSVLCNKVKTE